MVSLLGTYCNATADVGFLIDASHNGENYFQNVKTFVKSLARHLGISRDRTHLGVITYGFQPDLSIRLSDHQDIVSFERALDALPLVNTTARIDKALTLAAHGMFNSVNGARPGKPRLLVVLTSSAPGVPFATPGDSPAVIAERMRRDEGVSTVVIGVGGDVDPNDIVEIAGGGDHVFVAATNEVLSNEYFANQMKEVVCALGSNFFQPFFCVRNY